MIYWIIIGYLISVILNYILLRIYIQCDLETLKTPWTLGDRWTAIALSLTGLMIFSVLLMLGIGCIAKKIFECTKKINWDKEVRW